MYAVFKGLKNSSDADELIGLVSTKSRAVDLVDEHMENADECYTYWFWKPPVLDE